VKAGRKPAQSDCQHMVIERLLKINLFSVQGNKMELINVDIFQIIECLPRKYPCSENSRKVPYYFRRRMIQTPAQVPETLLGVST
jgi:hypothetical protein